MANNELRQDIFVTTRPFLGPKERKRLQNVQSVTDFVTEYEATHFAPIIEAYTRSTVVLVILALNLGGVFGSRKKAKVAFPSLFIKSKGAKEPSQSLQGLVTEPVTLPGVSIVKDDSSEPVTSSFEQTVLPKARSDNENQAQKSLKSPEPSLSTECLPYICQHRILNDAQSVLEKCCFEFAQTYLSDILEKHGWDCPQSVELGEWGRVLHNHFSNVPETATTVETGLDLKHMIMATVKLRNVAVHREPVWASSMEHMLDSALELTLALRSTKFAYNIKLLRSCFNKSVEEIKAWNKEVEGQWKDIQCRRQELEEEERALKRDIRMGEDHLIQSIYDFLPSSLKDLDMEDQIRARDAPADNFWSYGFHILL